MIPRLLIAGLALAAASGGIAKPRPELTIRTAAVPAGDAYAQGKALLAQGSPALAIDAFRRALRVDADSVDAHNGLAVAYDLLGRFDMSRAHYAQALAIEPGAAMVLYNYGYSRLLQGDRAAARPLLAEAAASTEAQARAAAATALAQLDADDRREQLAAAAAMAVPATRPTAWVERTSTLEQQLILDGTEAAGGLDAALVAVASAAQLQQRARLDRLAHEPLTQAPGDPGDRPVEPRLAPGSLRPRSIERPDADHDEADAVPDGHFAARPTLDNRPRGLARRAAAEAREPQLGEAVAPAALVASNPRLLPTGAASSRNGGYLLGERPRRHGGGSGGSAATVHAGRTPDGHAGDAAAALAANAAAVRALDRLVRGIGMMARG